ncbi:hypothetical protein BJP36_12415 [Moorena producens JHB]|uniref:Uncharacterized protein n=1 Tax=Moorena producens (strain JHB) TaxID=1454205 RepID=A0A1D9FZA6_MOOP1|nr:hypothetical protein [Moorena producens]AOY80604.1 hypothetical protein BJP36_12415 [Moorena producens JHB]
MTYSVDFKNQTDRTWTMVVFQEIPDSIGLDSVAWKKTTVPRSGESGVDWDIEYIVALANYKQTGGVGVYKASQKFNNISLGSKWKVVFKDGVQQLEPDGDAEKPELIVINNESNQLADVGIGMSGDASVYKRDVYSGSGGQFKVTPTYYVGIFNDLVLGTVISSNVIVGPLKVQFPSGMNKAVLTATLDGSTLKLALTYQNALVANYEQVQTLSRSIGSEFNEVLDDSEVQKGIPGLDINYTFAATLFFGALTVAKWAYSHQNLIANAAGVVIDNFSSFDRAACTFKVVGQSALACATAMDAIVKAIEDNAPTSLLQAEKCASLDSSSVSYTDLSCYTSASREAVTKSQSC